MFKQIIKDAWMTQKVDLATGFRSIIDNFMSAFDFIALRVVVVGVSMFKSTNYCLLCGRDGRTRDFIVCDLFKEPYCKLVFSSSSLCFIVFERAHTTLEYSAEELLLLLLLEWKAWTIFLQNCGKYLRLARDLRKRIKFSYVRAFQT